MILLKGGRERGQKTADSDILLPLMFPGHFGLFFVEMTSGISESHRNRNILYRSEKKNEKNVKFLING